MISRTTFAAKAGTVISSALVFLSVAPSAYAQSATLNLAPAKSMVDTIIAFIDSTLIPLIFGIAFIVFIWGVFRYFIAGGADEESRSKGKQLIAYGLIGFFVMIAVWGIVGLLLHTFGLSGGGTKPGLPTFNGTSQTQQTGNTSTGGTPNPGNVTPNPGNVPAGSGSSSATPGNPCYPLFDC